MNLSAQNIPFQPLWQSRLAAKNLLTVQRTSSCKDCFSLCWAYALCRKIHPSAVAVVLGAVNPSGLSLAQVLESGLQTAPSLFQGNVFEKERTWLL